ncbi:MAG: Thiamine import ATP-binding protein ThiQ [Alphaproteobacteria bacterium MarineAlpha2_Bin1]|nr:MAG: Thiamine import ATP-binding protein ThiQ [Alphaproteobacteria bacterium MarineAlpha2_Bin1]
MSKLVINTLFKSDKFILDINCTLNFSDGLIGVFGPSGSGKTLFLRIIAGLEKNSTGKVIFDEKIFQDKSKKIFLNTSQRKAILVFQENRLFSNLKVKDNILFGYRRNANKQSNNTFFYDVIDRLKIRYLLDRDINDLSGGEKQRVAIARSILADKNILLLDEPFSAQDNEIKKEIVSLIEDINKLYNIPTIIVTHSFEDLIKLAKKTLLIDAGRIRFFDETSKVISNFHIENDIINSQPSNLVECYTKKHDYDNGLTYISFHNSTLTVPLIDAKIGSKVLVKILSKDIIVSRLRPADISIRNILEATVTKIKKINVTFIDITCLIGETEIVSRITNLSFKELNLKENQKIYLLIKSTMIDKII